MKQHHNFLAKLVVCFNEEILQKFLTTICRAQWSRSFQNGQKMCGSTFAVSEQEIESHVLYIVHAETHLHLNVVVNYNF